VARIRPLRSSRRLRRVPPRRIHLLMVITRSSLGKGRDNQPRRLLCPNRRLLRMRLPQRLSRRIYSRRRRKRARHNRLGAT
jgi:hypothetical protein